jgi:hypothetical protein
MATTADSLLGSNGSFLDYTSVTTADTITSSQLASDLTDTDQGTYVLSTDPNAYVDLGFTGSNAIYNGAGADLALFFVGNNRTFRIQINNTTRTYNPTQLKDPTDPLGNNYLTVTDSFQTYYLTASLINLDDFGLAGSADPLAMSSFRVFLGDSSRPALSLVGGMYMQPAVVPLPLPALLFASGLGALGLFGRKRKQRD